MWPLSRRLRYPCHRRLALLTTGLLLGLLLTLGQAHVPTAIRPDGTLGTAVTPSNNIYTITGGTRPGDGPNLFHSFEAFSVGTGATARFSGPVGIANIVSRVTGGQLSTIDGRLQSEIAGANFYLLNPSGVLFGPNASLNVSGSFHVSTADFLRLADGATFFADLGRESILTVAPPAAFGFLGSQPAPVTVQGGWLQVPAGQALSVVGGDIQLVGGTLRAPSGRLQLASVASPGEVRFSPLELAPDLQVDGFARLGRLELSQDARLEASGHGGGTVLMRAGDVLVDRASIRADTEGDVHGASLGVDLWVTGEALLRNEALIGAAAHGRGNAGRLRLAASEFSLERSYIEAGTQGAGQAGSIALQVARLILTNGGQVRNITRGGGRAGDITIMATDTIAMDGRLGERAPGGFFDSRSGLFANTLSGGDAGRIVVSTPILTMDDSVIRTDAFSASQGQAGDIDVRVGRLTLTGGARISTRTRGMGGAGDLTVVATETIVIAGRTRIPEPADQVGPSGLSSGVNRKSGAGRIRISAPTLSMDDGEITARTIGDADAGDIDVQVRRLTLTGGARIASSTGESPGVGTRSGRGRGGKVTVVASDTISISGRSQSSPSGLFAESFGPGQGGDLQLTANHIELRDGGTIDARGTAGGAAGTVRIRAHETFQSQHGAVTTQSARAGGGWIELRAGRLIELRDSQVTTAVQGGAGDAGNITLTAPFVVLDGGQVITQASEGRGGNIHIGAGVFLANPASLVDASSQLGIDGAVDIQAPVADLGGTVTPLPQAFRPDAPLLHTRCATRLREGTVSSLVARGRDGVPASPEGVLPSRLDPWHTEVASPTREMMVTRRAGGRPDHQESLQGRRRPAPKDAVTVGEPGCSPQ